MTRVVKAPDERRSELIACAQKLFYTQGYQSTSVRDIVDEVGVAKGTFYYYFDSKQAILEALVAELSAARVALFEAILADQTLDAIQKWTRAVQVIGDWKIERKEQLLALARMMQIDENVLLRHKLEMRTVQMAVPILGKIIAQGVTEGVFETPFVEEAAENVFAIAIAFSKTLTAILLNPDHYENPLALARRKTAAMQAAIERVLGAAPGSLPIMDENTLTAWFAD
jgi:AcrR family transcriptional regulator